jgi:hypothetical protein
MYYVLYTKWMYNEELASVCSRVSSSKVFNSFQLKLVLGWKQKFVLICMRFEVLKAVNIKNGEFCDVMPCSFIHGYQRLDELAASIWFYSEDGSSRLFLYYVSAI